MLKQRRVDSPKTFQLGYQNKALVDGDLTYPSFDLCCTKTNSIVPSSLVQNAGWRFYVGVDLAGKKRPGNVIFTLAVDPTRDVRVPVDIRRGAWTSDQTARQIVEVYRKFSPDVIMVENNGYQQSLIDWMRVLPGVPSLPIYAHTTGANKINPEIGIISLQVEFDGRMWEIYLPDHGIVCDCAWCVWAEEMRGHPAATSTDCVMACWFAREGIRRFKKPIADVGKITYQDILTQGYGEMFEDPYGTGGNAHSEHGW